MKFLKSIFGITPKELKNRISNLLLNTNFITTINHSEFYDNVEKFTDREILKIKNVNKKWEFSENSDSIYKLRLPNRTTHISLDSRIIIYLSKSDDFFNIKIFK